MKLIEDIVTTLMNSEAEDLKAIRSLSLAPGKTGKPGKAICEVGQVLALGGDYVKSQAGNKQAQRRVRKSMAIVALLAKAISEATKKK